MKREEKLEKYLDYQYMYENGDPSYINGIKVGVSWADKNPKSPWISVEDKLPEKGVLVIVKTGIDNCYLAAKDSVALPKDEFMLPQLCEYVDEVTHWMPIPELPKEE